MLTDCDPFTHNFLRKMGVHLNAPCATPTDPYTKLRQEVNMWPCLETVLFLEMENQQCVL